MAMRCQSHAVPRRGAPIRARTGFSGGPCLRSRRVLRGAVPEPPRSGRPSSGTITFRRPGLRNRAVPKDMVSEPCRSEGLGFGTVPFRKARLRNRAVPKAHVSEPGRSENGHPTRPENFAALRKGGFRFRGNNPSRPRCSEEMRLRQCQSSGVLKEHGFRGKPFSGAVAP